MIDTRAVAQEVQDQLHAAVQRGQEQLRKGQEQVRKSQDQVRKGREAVSGAIRAGNELAKAVRPSIPTSSARVPSLGALTSPAKLRANAQELADHLIATQRSLASKALHAASPVADQVIAKQRDLAGKALHAAGPLVAESVAKLTQVVGNLTDVRKFGHASTTTPSAVATDEVTAAADTARPAATEVAPEKGAAKPRATKAGAKATGTSKAAGASKTRTTKK